MAQEFSLAPKVKKKIKKKCVGSLFLACVVWCHGYMFGGGGKHGPRVIFDGESIAMGLGLGKNRCDGLLFNSMWFSVFFRVFACSPGVYRAETGRRDPIRP